MSSSRPSRPTPADPETAATREPIAIIGMGCRFPGASSPAAFWRLLTDGIDAIREVPPGRFDIDALYDARPATAGKVNTRWGGFVDHLDRLDAEFFGIAPREAERLDPQQRMLLEIAWDALEDAGQVPEQLTGTATGVFIGMWINEYESRLFRDPAALDFYATIGTGRYAASGRLSYFFGLQGPSMTLDTGCSSSLVAVHLACQSLWTGESELALAGAANAIVEPFVTIAYSQSRMMAPDGRCKFGDARANGYVRSDGAGMVVLKPLSKALADGNPIYATIVGSAVTNDGRSSGFLTTPGREGQEEMLRRAYRSAGISPGRVDYVEAHGTGTRAGDPVELQALGAVLGRDRPADRPCHIGSVKTNIGHTEGASGLAGLIKAALCVRNRAIPANLHFETPNPDIPWSELPLVIQRQYEPWPVDKREAIAGVSSFGISGTNAHIVLREAPAAKAPSPIEEARPLLLPISAHTPAALTAMASSYRSLLAEEAEGRPLTSICYTAGAHRTHHEHRFAIAAPNRETLIEQLDAFLAGEPRQGVAVGRRRTGGKVAFVFPGQGSQWRGMGRQLYLVDASFQFQMDACDAAISQFTGWSVVDQLHADGDRSRMTEIDVIQPTLFAIEVSLAAMWRAWGIQPDAVVGHSMGEVAAACVAGALTLFDAARIICRRSRLLKRTSGKGAMAVVELTIPQAEEELRGTEHLLSVAVSNSARSTVISGDPATLDALIARLEARDVFCRRVKVDVASHSPQMDPLRADLADAVAAVRPNVSSVPIYSTVLGAATDGTAFGPAYWVDNLRKPVLFSKAIQLLIRDGHTTFIEMSPHPILMAAVQEGLQDASVEGLATASVRRDDDEWVSMLSALGAVHVAGHAVDWKAVYPGCRRPVALPPYQYQRERFWIDADSAADLRRVASEAVASDSRAALQATLFEPMWAEERRGTGEGAGNVTAGTWAVFGNPTDVASALRGELERRGATCFTVSAGAERMITDSRAFVIQPDSEGDCEWVLAGLTAGGPLRGIVYVAMDDTARDSEKRSADVALDLTWNVLQLAKALATGNFEMAPKLCLVTRGAQKVTADDRVDGIVESALWGVARAITDEHPEFDGGLIDLDPNDSPDASAAAIADELLLARRVDQVAFRNHTRYTLRLKSATETRLASPAVHIEPGAAYLITGGLGDLGLHAARWLVEQGARRLILAGRTALPPRREWSNLGETDPRGRRVRAVTALEAKGATVHVATVDVADEVALGRWVATYREDNWPAIRGVVHCAGILVPQLLEDLTKDTVRRVFLPKVAGAAALHRVLDAEALDFFVLYSSAAALLPIPGQAHYAAANAFLDAFSHYRQARGYSALSLNWAVWAEIGMAASFGAAEQFSARGVGRIDPALADAVLGVAMSGTGQVAVTPFDMERWRQNVFAPSTASFLESLLSAPPATAAAARVEMSWRDALLKANGGDRLHVLETLVRDEVARVVKRQPDRIDTSKPLRTLGLDSLMGLELRNRLERATALKLPATLVWNFPTIAALAPELAHRMGIALDDAAAATEATPPAASDAEIESLLQEIAALSDDDARRLLAGEA